MNGHLRIIDLTGKRFARLHVVNFHWRRANVEFNFDFRLSSELSFEKTFELQNSEEQTSKLVIVLRVEFCLNKKLEKTQKELGSGDSEGFLQLHEPFTLNQKILFRCFNLLRTG